MWNAYATPLRLTLKPPRRLLALLWLCYGLAVLSCLLLPLGLAWRLIGCIVLIVLLFKTHGRICRASAELKWLVWGEEDRWQSFSVSGEVENIRMEPCWYAQRYLVILHFKAKYKRARPLVLLPDQMGKDEFRKLRVRLRIAAATESL